MKAAIDEQRRTIEELDGASQRQEWTIARQVSEIKGLKTARTKCEDKLKRSTEAIEAQELELRQLNDENKAKEDRLIGKVGKLKEDIPRMASPTRRQFPPSTKKGGQFDVPDGIITHLTRECGGNVHDRHVGVVRKGDSWGQSALEDI
jgi:hypothetical protein